LFLDPRDRGTFGSRLGVLAGALFGILLSMRAADAFIGDAGRLTLVSKIHLVALALIMATASIALLEQRHVDRGQRVIPISGLAAGCRNRGALCPDQPRARDERRVALSVVAANRRSLERSERGCPELAAHLHRAYQGCGEVLQRP
jgi:hypothetical protein